MFRICVLHRRAQVKPFRERGRFSLVITLAKRQQLTAMPQTYTNKELWQFVLRESGDSWRPDLSHPPPNRSFPVEVTHSLLVGPEPKWDGLRLKLLEILQKGITAWSSLSLLRRRPTVVPIYDDDTTVVIIIGQDTTPAAETNLFQELHSMCCDEGHLALRIELIRGEVAFFNDALGSSYKRKPTIGSSLGATDVDWASGTLGGFVKLRKMEVTMSCALTCHHVLQPAHPSTTTQQVTTMPSPLLSEIGEAIRIDQLARSSSPIHQVTAMSPPFRREIGDAIGVDQPAPKDHLELRSTLSKYANFCQSQINRITGAPADDNDPTFADDREDRLQSVRGKHQECTDHQRLIESADRRFGSIWATSGFLVAPKGFCLDWGVVLVDQDREGRNFVNQALITCHLNR